MKLHVMMISIGLVGLIFLGYVSFWGEGVVIYGVSDMNTDNLASINNSLEELNDISERTKSKMELVQGLPAGLDILGSALIGAFGALETAVTSVDIISKISQSSAEYIPMGNLTNPFLLFIGTSLLIIIFVAVLANYLNKTGGV